MLELEQPDLVVFSGDQQTGFMYKLLADAAPGWTEENWRRLIVPVNEAGIPYAMALGGRGAGLERRRAGRGWGSGGLGALQQSWG